MNPAGLVVAVARLYYEHGLTHHQIAEQLGLSRIKVTRLLAQARAEGVVEIRVNGPEDPFGELVQALIAKYHLDRVWVAPTAEGDGARTQVSARTGAACLAHHLREARVVAVGLSATLGAAISALPAQASGETAPSFVPMAGSWGGWQQGLNPAENAHNLAARLGGRAYGFPAPLLAPSTGVAQALTTVPEVADALAFAASADAVLFGVGGLEWSASPLQTSINGVERAELVRWGAVGDVAARFFDGSGSPVTGRVDARAIGMSLEQLRAVPTRILLAQGSRKLHALHAALASGMATVLCTDSLTGRALLAEDL